MSPAEIPDSENWIRTDVTVVPGRGIAGQVRSAEVEVLSASLGVNFVPGSLNLISRRPVWLRSDRATKSFESGAMYWPARLSDIDVLVNRGVGSTPAHVFEVFAPVHLRTELGLRDLDELSLEIPRDVVDEERANSFLNRFVWAVGWRSREKFYYRDGWYLNLVHRSWLSRYLWRAYQ